MASVVCTMLAITACHNTEITEEKEDWSKPADHTLLMYLVGDNSLSTLLENNVRDAQKAILDSVMSGSINLVVMKDNNKQGDSTPSLYWVHRNDKMGLDTVMIKQWDQEENTASTDFLADALKLTFSRFDTKIKGIALGSHASGWTPLTNNNPYPAPQRRAFGFDDKNNPVASIELWDLAATLRNGPKLDYLLMDCCHMGTVEVAYEMRDVARYMLACPTEDEGAGLPYCNIVTALSRISDVSRLPKVLDYCGRCYFDANARFTSGATIALYDLSLMPQLADAYRQLIQANSARLATYATATGDVIDQWIAPMQHYGREADGLHNRYYFFDITSIIDWLAEADPTAAAQVRNIVEKAVIAKYSTSVYRGINITQYSGMAVGLPEVLHLASVRSHASHFSPFDERKLKRCYQLTAWGAYMGY